MAKRQSHARIDRPRKLAAMENASKVGAMKAVVTAVGAATNVVAKATMPDLTNAHSTSKPQHRLHQQQRRMQTATRRSWVRPDQPARAASRVTTSASPASAAAVTAIAATTVNVAKAQHAGTEATQPVRAAHHLPIQSQIRRQPGRNGRKQLLNL